MKKKQITAILLSALLIFGCSACAGNTNESSASSETSVSSAEPTPTEESDVVPEDGVYTAEFKTDSSMFQANEACEGMGTLTVENGEMTFHVSLRSKKILNLYLGTAEDAKQNESEWLQPTTDTVTYKDGTSEEVYGFDIPLKSVDKDFDLALIGTKGTWYDHKVSVRNPQPIVEDTASDAETEAPEDGTYTCNVTLEGGSGRATIESPTELTVADGKMTAKITWSSPNYDYMIVNEQKILNDSKKGTNSHFTIPVPDLTRELDVIADTLAMGTPYEIPYQLQLYPDSIKSKSTLPQEGGGILNHVVQERRKQDYTGKRR